jgi:hypothetical protein
MELFKAHKQWASRPDDERFTSITALHQATKAYAQTAVEKADVPVSSLRVENIDGDVQLVGRQGIPAKLTHWAFGQLAARVTAPASYLRTLPATLAVQNLNHGLAHRVAQSADSVVSLLFHNSGALLLRALTSDRYERVWNWEITDRLLDLETQGWEPARPDIRVQDDRLPLYASDHDMFAFIRHTDRVIKEGRSGDVLQRGLIVENSEVGASKLRLTRFLYREMCGNHIIWGAEGVTEVALRHVGNIRDRFGSWETEIRKYLDSSASDDEAKIETARTKTIAGTKVEVLDALFGKRTGLTRKALDAGYDATQPDQDGDPRTVWGIVQGLTRYSQTVPYADERVTIDRAAGKIIDMAAAF